MRLSARTFAIALAAAAAACADSSPLTAPPDLPAGPAFGFSDGRNGNANFFFLPPYAPNPRNLATYEPGAFNPNLRPVVEICRLDPQAQPALSRCVAGPPIRRFSGNQVMLFNDSDDNYYSNFYKIQWIVYQDRPSTSEFYRVRVFVAGVELGYLDLDPAPTGVRPVITGEFVRFGPNGELLIPFRIERGALVSSGGPCPDCAEAVVGNSGGTYVLGTETGTLVRTNTGFAGGFFPNGWLDGVTVGEVPLTDAVVTIKRRQVGSDNNCFGAEGVGLLQFEGCYDYEIYHAGAPVEIVFARQATVGQCIEAGSSNPFYDNLLLHANDVGEPLYALEAASAPFISAAACTSSFGGSPFMPGSGAMMDRVGDGLLHFAMLLGRALAPRQAWAVDQGLGGRLDRFSALGWAVARAMSAWAGTGQSGAPGSLLAVAPEVLVTTRHGDVVPLAGVPVTFTITAGGGSLSATAEIPITSVTVTTGANGRASVPWRLGATAGTNTLVATVAGAPASVTFGATGVSGSAMIAGAVRNATGALIPGAFVEITSLETGTVTNSDGYYSMTLPPAISNGQTVTLRASYTGYTPVSRSITLTPGPQTQDFVLPLGGVIGFEFYDNGTPVVGCEGPCPAQPGDFDGFGLVADFVPAASVDPISALLRFSSSGFALSNPDFCAATCLPQAGTIRLHFTPNASAISFVARGPAGVFSPTITYVTSGETVGGCGITETATERTYSCTATGGPISSLNVASSGRFYVDNVSITP